MIEYEEIKKTNTKKLINEKLLKYGTPFTCRNEMKFAEGCEEGEAIVKVKQRLVN